MRLLSIEYLEGRETKTSRPNLVEIAHRATTTKKSPLATRRTFLLDRVTQDYNINCCILLNYKHIWSLRVELHNR
jgi:hypothetical protein